VDVRLIKSYTENGPKVGEIGELVEYKLDYDGDKRVLVKFPSQNGNITVLYANQVFQCKAKVILFKESGKYYTEEEWEIPTEEELEEKQKDIPREMRHFVFLPTCMRFSKDFRRIGTNGAVLVVTQEPWGYPHLFPGV
jgi:hypothetical protein